MRKSSKFFSSSEATSIQADESKSEYHQIQAPVYQTMEDPGCSPMYESAKRSCGDFTFGFLDGWCAVFNPCKSTPCNGQPHLSSARNSTESLGQGCGLFCGCACCVGLIAGGIILG